MRKLIAAAVAAAVIVSAVPANAAGPSGAYKGKIKYQGYDISFNVKNGKVSKIVANLLQDCDGDGSSETMTLAPKGSFKLKNGRVHATPSDRYDSSVAHYDFDIELKGSGAKGYIREWDSVDGAGVVCDTLKRDFTAKRS